MFRVFSSGMDRFVIDKERGIIPETSKSSDDFDVLDRFFDMNEGVVVVRGEASSGYNKQQ